MDGAPGVEIAGFGHAQRIDRIDIELPVTFLLELHCIATVAARERGVQQRVNTTSAVTSFSR